MLVSRYNAVKLVGKKNESAESLATRIDMQVYCMNTTRGTDMSSFVGFKGYEKRVENFSPYFLSQSLSKLIQETARTTNNTRVAFTSFHRGRLVRRTVGYKFQKECYLRRSFATTITITKGE